MKDKIEKLIEEVNSFVADNQEHLEAFRIKMMSKKGKITELF